MQQIKVDVCLKSLQFYPAFNKRFLRDRWVYNNYLYSIDLK